MKPRGHRYAGTLAGRDTARHLKLAQIVPEATLPVVQQPRASVAGRGGSGLQELGRSLQQGAEALARAQDETERRRLRLADGEARRGASDFHFNAAIFAAELDNERDPEAYAQRFRQGLDEHERTIAQTLKTPEGRALFAEKAKDIRRQLAVSAIKKVGALDKDRALGFSHDIVDRQFHLAGLVPTGDPAAWLPHFLEATKAIEADRRLVGDEETNKRLTANRQRFFEQRALQHARDAPEDFMAKAGTVYAGLDPKRRDQIVEQAEAERDKQRKDAREREDAYVKEFRERLALDIRDRVEGGEDMQARVSELRDQIGEQHHKELLALNRVLRDKRQASAVKGETDAATTASARVRVVLAAGVYNGTIRRQDQILEMTDLLPGDTIALLGLLGTETTRRRERGETERDQQIRDGMAILKERLRTTGDLNFDALGSEVLARAQTEYITKARGDATLAPHQFAIETADKFAPAVLERRELSAEDVAKMLRVNPTLAVHIGEGRRVQFERELPEPYRTGDSRGAIAADFRAGKITLAQSDKYFRIVELLQLLKTQKPAEKAKKPAKQGKP